ncbi:MAG: alpha-galactosidase, partial [Lentisphaeria bacterium]|nr:alpha-galactosidase [Lentisphaeria bacterium]
HFVFTAPLRSTAFPEFRGKAEKNLSEFAIACVLHNVSITEIDTGDICVFAANDPQGALEEWADENATRRNPPICKEYGWNSWDYYRWTITEEEVLENARFIASDPVLSKKIKRIIVDDGWQYCYGVWEPNPLFPHGMKYLAEQITALGFEPGLWFAPTVIEPQCPIAQLDGDMLALSEGGQPTLAFRCMERRGFLLDPTVPKARDFIRKTFEKYVEMGFKYFKLDFMGTTLNARRFHDESVPRSEIQRLIVKAVAEGVRGRAKILGCNYIFGAGNEFVDDVRVSSDIHSRWDSVVDNAVATAVNAHTNGRLWRNDPDFSVIRGRDTSDDPDLYRLKCYAVYTLPEDEYKPIYDFALSDLSLEQAEVSLSMVVMAAGAINLSDKLTRLNAKGVDLLRRLVSAPVGETGVALDQFESERPSLWLQKVDGRFARALLINWTDKEKTLEIDLARHGIDATEAKDFWRDVPIAISDGVLKATLPPTSCRLAVF